MSIDTREAPAAHLTSTSYLVLGLIEREGPSTPYELKRHVAATIGHFWSFPHAPWGSETRIRSRRGGVVLVDEPAEQVPPANIARADRDRDGDRGFGQR
jgi:hypothetical protein